MATTLWAEDIENIINGSCFLGSGGGGPLALAKEVMKGIDEHLPINLFDISEVGDYERIVVSAGVGAPSDPGSNFFKSPYNSFKALQTYIGTEFSYAMPGETGAMNSIVPMLVSILSQDKCVSVINADGAGRAMPEIQMSTFALENISTNPSSIGNEEGDTKILHDETPQELDQEIRHIIEHAPKFQGSVAVTTYIMNGKKLNEPNTVVPDTVIMAKKIGNALKSDQRIQEITDIMNNDYNRAVLGVYTGNIKSFDSHQKGGFDYGTTTIETDGNYTITLNFVNENLVAWFDNGENPIWGPASICTMSPNGDPYSNAEIAQQFKPGTPFPVILMVIEAAKEIDNAAIAADFHDVYEKFFGKKA